MKLSSFKCYFQMPVGLVFGPCRAPPPEFKKMKSGSRRMWCWSQSERGIRKAWYWLQLQSKNPEESKGKRIVWSKARSERQRKEKLPERKKKREDLSRKKKREDLLKTRKQRREEKQRKKEAGEPLVTKKKAKRDLKSHHGAEKVDATILKLLGKSHKSCKKVGPLKSKKSDMKVEEVAAPKWRNGMREERRESWSARAQLRKRTPCPKNLVKTKATVSGQIVICSEQKTSKESYSKEDETKTAEEKKVEAAHQVPPIVDVGADYEADGGQCSSGDGAVEMSWPLPIQAPVEPMPPCMEFYQVRIY